MSTEKQVFEKAVEAALVQNGYAEVKRGKFAKKIGLETEICVYPQVRSRGSSLELQPIVGSENATLKSKLKACGTADEDFRACHVYLAPLQGAADLWNGSFTLWAPTAQSGQIINMFMAALEGIA